MCLAYIVCVYVCVCVCVCVENKIYRDESGSRFGELFGERVERARHSQG